jgi:glycyl-tRNA synthetase beta chain
MTTTKSLLVELFVEELPPKSLKKLGESFGITLFSELQKANGLDNGAAITAFASPRRLAAHITNVLPVAAAKPVKVRLMPVSVALDAEGIPTVALIKKLEYLGLEYLLKARKSVWDERISREGEGKNESLFHTDVAAGMPLHESLQFALNQAIAKLPINKVMTYQLADGWSSVNFVRPAHRLVALHGADVVPVKALGLVASNATEGHRFMSSGIIYIRDADSYAEQLLNEGKVIANFAERRASIVKQLESFRLSKESNEVIRPDALLDEVTALVEWPKVYECHFDYEFLSVPQECLILTMQTNQKYFPCTLDSALRNRFLIVSNIETSEPASIIGGNERVVRPRLADAKFFFDQDRKKTLESRVPRLMNVVYHNKLGSLGVRIERVMGIASAIGEKLSGRDLAVLAERAALLAKADLLTDMVGEFPELQGVMGWYYARQEKQPDDIAFAIMDHYKPRFAGDELPRNAVGICVALADKLETLVGMFGIGELPTGDKDPFALRRHALGVIRILIEKNLPLELDWLLKIGTGAFHNIDNTLLLDTSDLAFDGKADSIREQLTEFIYDRLAGSLREQGYSAQEVDAVLSLRPQQFIEVTKCLAAVRAFASLPEAAALAAANKRVGNILKKEGIVAGVDAVNDKLLQEPAEQALHQALSQIAPKADAAFAAGDYTASLQALAALRAPVDAFFDNVMVNAEDAALRTNRLALLSQLHQAMNRVADISKLAT